MPGHKYDREVLKQGIDLKHIFLSEISKKMNVHHLCNKSLIHKDLRKYCEKLIKVANHIVAILAILVQR